MPMILQKLEQAGKEKLPSCRTGDTVKLSLRIKEGEKERLQSFQGLVLKVQGRGHQKSITVRKVSGGVGVERTIALASPRLNTLEVISSAKVRRSRIFFIRNLKGRSSRLKAVSSPS